MKTCIEIIVEALEAMAPEVQLPAATSETEVCAAFKTISRENPEIFWFSGRYTYDPATARVALRYSRAKDWRDKMREIIDFRVRYEFRPERLLGLSDLEKVAYVYWWISLRCRYSTHAMYADSIVGPISDRYSTCEGFARAAKYLLGLIGVRSELVYGRFIEKFGSREHLCWNRVYIDGRPFHVDLGMADIQRGFLYDPIYGYNIFGGFLWDFFCMSDSDIARCRTIDDDCRTIACRHSLLLRDVDVKLISCTCPGRPESEEFRPWPEVHIDGEIVECEAAPTPELAPVEPVADITETHENKTVHSAHKPRRTRRFRKYHSATSSLSPRPRHIVEKVATSFCDVVVSQRLTPPRCANSPP